MRDSHFLRLIVDKCHIERLHGGTEDTLSLLRNRFWVVRGRRVVSRIIKRCVTCKRHHSKGILPPPSPPLPVYRVSADYCFQSTGVDFAGPLLVKSIYGSDTKMFKAYIALFTCAASRAVHLELTPDLDSATFIRALKRFIARRGFPSLLISDNATTFTSRELKSFLLINSIEKSNILPATPWWGGVYERLVRSVKQPLKKILGKAKLNYEEMETILLEVERIINTRPLTYLYEDDISEPLTPSHLLTGRNISARPIKYIEKEENNAESLSKRIKYIHTLINNYWKKFNHNYLAELREHHMYDSKRKTSVENKLKIDDIVVIKEDSIRPRNSWRLGRVDSLITGRDGFIRGANLSTLSNQGSKSIWSRPLQKIIPLEVQHESINDAENEDQIDKPSRKRRYCAINGETIRRLAAGKM